MVLIVERILGLDFRLSERDFLSLSEREEDRDLRFEYEGEEDRDLRSLDDFLTGDFDLCLLFLLLLLDLLRTATFLGRSDDFDELPC